MIPKTRVATSTGHAASEVLLSTLSAIVVFAITCLVTLRVLDLVSSYCNYIWFLAGKLGNCLYRLVNSAHEYFAEKSDSSTSNRILLDITLRDLQRYYQPESTEPRYFRRCVILLSVLFPHPKMRPWAWDWYSRVMVKYTL